jgi:hypothetical protein
MSEAEHKNITHSLTLSPAPLLLLLIFTLLLSAELNNARLRLQQKTETHTTGGEVVKEGSLLSMQPGKFLFSILSNIQQVEHENLPKIRHHYQNPSNKLLTYVCWREVCSSGTLTGQRVEEIKV